MTGCGYSAWPIARLICLVRTAEVSLGSVVEASRSWRSWVGGLKYVLPDRFPRYLLLGDYELAPSSLARRRIAMRMTSVRVRPFCSARSSSKIRSASSSVTVVTCFFAPHRKLLNVVLIFLHVGAPVLCTLFISALWLSEELAKTLTIILFESRRCRVF